MTASRAAVLGAPAFGILVLLTGCTVGPNFMHPAPPAVTDYTKTAFTGTASSQGAGGIAQHMLPGQDIPGQWWELYHSPALNTLVTQALRNNPDLQAAQAALRQANENTYSAQGGLFPSVGAQVQGTHERLSSAQFGTPGSSTEFSLISGQLQVSYAPDVFGGTQRRIEQSAAQAEYQRDELEAAYLTLTSNVVVAAIQEASLRGQIAATQDIIKLESDQLGVAQRQFDLGAVARSDVLSQQSTLAATTATLPPLQKGLAQTRNQLTALAGKFPSEEIDQTFDLDHLTLPGELPLSLPSTLVAQRPDIRAADATLHAASAGIGVALANELPQFSISASAGDLAISPATLFTPGSLVWSLAGSVAQTIFDGGQKLHAERAAVAGFDQAAAQYRSTVIKAFQNVADALRALQFDALTLQAQTNAVQTAQASLNLARDQFQLGAINYLTLLDAERTYQQALVGRVQAEASRYSDTAALFQALGGGWWNRHDVDPATQGKPDRSYLSSVLSKGNTP